MVTVKAPAQWDILLKAAHVPSRSGIEPRHSPCWGGLAQPWACCAGGCYAQAWCFAGLRPQLSSPLGGVVSGLSPGSSRPTCVFFRRAHLKECFETLKRNIPNVDDKKTSNLSVLRSALRYIQVRAAPGAGGVQRRGERNSPSRGSVSATNHPYQHWWWQGAGSSGDLRDPRWVKLQLLLLGSAEF